MLGQPTYRRLTCRQDSAAEAGGGGARGFALEPSLGPRHWAVQLGAGHSPLALLCTVTVCVPEPLLISYKLLVLGNSFQRSDSFNINCSIHNIRLALSTVFSCF